MRNEGDRKRKKCKNKIKTADIGQCFETHGSTAEQTKNKYEKKTANGKQETTRSNWILCECGQLPQRALFFRDFCFSRTRSTEGWPFNDDERSNRDRGHAKRRNQQWTNSNEQCDDECETTNDSFIDNLDHCRKLIAHLSHDIFDIKLWH